MNVVSVMEKWAYRRCNGCGNPATSLDCVIELGDNDMIIPHRLLAPGTPEEGMSIPSVSVLYLLSFSCLL